MGGLGTRFQAHGISTPKPLIPLDHGVPMFRRAVSSFANSETPFHVRTVFIVRTEHMQDPHCLDAGIIGAMPGAVVVPLDHNTRGAVETCLAAKNVLYPDRPVVVLDCDLYCRSRVYDNVLLGMLTGDGDGGDIGGVLMTFKSKAPRYSYAALDPAAPADVWPAPVVRTAEKDPSISDRAVIGAYGFGSAGLFFRACDELMTRDVAEIREYYLSLLYNIMLRSFGVRVVACAADAYGSFGTPEEMDLYLAGKQSHMTE
eukprot:PhM_4_TR632/c0_g2_i1/m.86446